MSSPWQSALTPSGSGRRCGVWTAAHGLATEAGAAGDMAAKIKHVIGNRCIP